MEASKQNSTQTSEEIYQPSQDLEAFALQLAKNKTNVAKWDLNILVFMFAVLIVVVILISLDVDTRVVATIAIAGLALVWLLGWRRGIRLLNYYYYQELNNLQQTPSKQPTELLEQLTTREMEILYYVARGYTNKSIASRLGISVSTVKIFIRRILSKLNANDRTEAVVIAIKNNLISI